ncbi:recombinase family protein [Acidovorax sp. CCYZU-2555]|nr:recombinase family protein [Acidovorax sp. CCYZU-2555]
MQARTITETVSGSVAANERASFRKLLDKLESSDVLVVTKLDRLGRNAMDVRATVDALASMGVRVHCLALGGVDLTSEADREAILSALAHGATVSSLPAKYKISRATVINIRTAGAAVASI